MAIVTNFINWSNILENKWLILDSCVIINIFKYRSEELIEKFNKKNVTLCTIHPVVLQALNTDNKVERIRIRSFIHSYVTILPMNNLLKNAEEMQENFISSGCRPDAIDFYLASAISTYSNGKTFLATSNLSHFQKNFFDRVGYILLENDSSINTIALLAYRNNETNGNDEDMPF